MRAPAGSRGPVLLRLLRRKHPPSRHIGRAREGKPNL